MNAHASSLPKRWTVTHQLTAQRNAQALLGLDHTVRSLALKHGADPAAAEALVAAARSVFTITNAVPVALSPDGSRRLGQNGLPLTVEEWTRHRLA